VQRGDVVVINFPYSDQTGSKKRPALVVQDDRWNSSLDDTIVAFITSGAAQYIGALTQKLIRLGTQESYGSGLRSDSVIECQTLLTCDQALIIAIIGQLSPIVMRDIDDCLRASLGL
jgi:mRNA interferase MazF